MAKLADTQLVILNTAAKRDSRLVLPLSRTLKLDKSAIPNILKGLVTKKLINERPATKDEKEWRTDEDGRYTLIITDTGLRALGLDTETATTPIEQPAKPSRAPKAERTITPAKPKNSGKLDGVLLLVRRSNGASITDLQKATGWQPHSIRAAMTGFRKQGVEITRSKNKDGVTVYTAAQAEARA